MSNHFTARVSCPHCHANVYADVAITPNLTASTDEGIKLARTDDAPDDVPTYDRREGLSTEALDRAVTRALEAPFGHGHPEEVDVRAQAVEMLSAPGAPIFESPEARAHAVDVLAAKLAAEAPVVAQPEASTENPAWPEGVGFERPGPV